METVSDKKSWRDGIGDQLLAIADVLGVDPADYSDHEAFIKALKNALNLRENNPEKPASERYTTGTQDTAASYGRPMSRREARRMKRQKEIENFKPPVYSCFCGDYNDQPHCHDDNSVNISVFEIADGLYTISKW